MSKAGKEEEEADPAARWMVAVEGGAASLVSLSVGRDCGSPCSAPMAGVEPVPSVGGGREERGRGRGEGGGEGGEREGGGGGGEEGGGGKAEAAPVVVWGVGSVDIAASG